MIASGELSDNPDENLARYQKQEELARIDGWQAKQERQTRETYAGETDGKAS